MSNYVPPTTPIGHSPQGPIGGQQGYPGPPPPPKSKTWLWVLGGCGMILLIGAIALSVIGYFAYRKTTEFVDDTKRNPALALAKLGVAANPDLETVSVDERGGTITVKDKKTGKIVTVDFEDVKNGKIVVQGEGDERVELSARGADESGSVEIKSNEGTMKIGAGANAEKVPDWLPSYPGAKATGVYSMQGPDGDTGSFAFKTSDSIEKVMAFYAEELKSGGLTVNTTSFKGGPSGSGGLVSASESRNKRSVQVTIGSDGGETAVNVSFQNKH